MPSSSIIRLWSCWAVSWTGGAGADTVAADLGQRGQADDEGQDGQIDETSGSRRAGGQAACARFYAWLRES